jgi:hypothetical protein
MGTTLRRRRGRRHGRLDRRRDDLPAGPALIVIPAGLAILGLEFAFARRWLCQLRATGKRVLTYSWPGRSPPGSDSKPHC